MHLDDETDTDFVSRAKVTSDGGPVPAKLPVHKSEQVSCEMAQDLYLRRGWGMKMTRILCPGRRSLQTGVQFLLSYQCINQNRLVVGPYKLIWNYGITVKTSVRVAPVFSALIV